jgi:hypothetical protein
MWGMNMSESRLKKKRAKRYSIARRAVSQATLHRTNVVFAIVGLGAGLTDIIQNFQGIRTSFLTLIDSAMSFLSSPANAQSRSPARETPASIDPNGMVFYVLLAGLFVVLIGCLLFVFFSNKPKSETERAWDLIKVICGFFIGSLARGA